MGGPTYTRHRTNWVMQRRRRSQKFDRYWESLLERAYSKYYEHAYSLEALAENTYESHTFYVYCFIEV